jgi:hypothetical protein
MGASLALQFVFAMVISSQSDVRSSLSESLTSYLEASAYPLERVTLPQATGLAVGNSMNHFIIPEIGEDAIITIVSACALGN